MDINEDDLLVIKHVLEDAIWLSKSWSRARHSEFPVYQREPCGDMERVLAQIIQQLADIDADQQGLLEIEAGNGDEQ